MTVERMWKFCHFLSYNDRNSNHICHFTTASTACIYRLRTPTKCHFIHAESVKRTHPRPGVSSFRPHQHSYNKHENNFPIKRMDAPQRSSSYRHNWIVKSGCHFSCMRFSLGIQIVMSSVDRSTNIQLCKTQTVVNVYV